MPNTCCVPFCKGNYPTGPKVSVFSFPRTAQLIKMWLVAIQRKDFLPNKYSKVCELHFTAEDFVITAQGYDEKKGKLIVVKLHNRRLQPHAVPSIFLERSILPERSILLKKPRKSKNQRPSRPEKKKVDLMQLEADVIKIVESEELSMQKNAQLLEHLPNSEIKGELLSDQGELLHNAETDILLDPLVRVKQEIIEPDDITGNTSNQNQVSVSSKGGSTVVSIGQMDNANDDFPDSSLLSTVMSKGSCKKCKKRKQSSESVNDSYDEYGKFVAEQLRKLDKKSLMHVQRRVANLLGQASAGKFKRKS